MIRFESLIVVVFCAILRVALPSHGLAVMSIDLGTEFMKIAIVKPGVPMEIALNKESRRKTPVIVAIKGKDREFGEAAISRANKIPGQSYMFLTELVGKTVENGVVEEFLENFPFYKMKMDKITNELIFEHDNTTNFSVEEILSMVLKKAREFGSDFAEQKIDSAVVTVPAYFTQSERRAIERACKLADLNVLQLMNDNTAVALNFGIDRRKDLNKTGSTFLFYDMGSRSTICTVAKYEIIKIKENNVVEEIPQLTIKSVEFDRNLGGLEFQIRLRNFFIEKFHEKYPKIDLWKNGKALTKLFREAERAKHVLSANNEYFAQVEGLIDEIDFKQKITRQQFEQISSDLFERVKKPIENILRTGNVVLSEIQQVLIFGGSTRIPRVQSELSKALGGIELGKSLNTDEAAALGAAYQAATLSKGFRVKKFLVKDSNIFPVNIIFERENEKSQEKFVEKTIFPRFNPFPSKKSITFNRHIDDFSFDIRYGNFTFLPFEQRKNLGKIQLFRVHVTGVRAAFEKQKNGTESKGVKAHFHLDENCFVKLDRVDFVFEKAENRSKDEENPSTLAKIGKKISSFFSSNTLPDENPIKDETSTIESTSNGNENVTEKNDDKKNSTENFKSNFSTSSNGKTVTIRENLSFRIEIKDFSDPSVETRIQSRKKLAEFDEHDRRLAAIAKAKNNLEGFIYDVRDKLDQDSIYRNSITAEERTTIVEKMTEIDGWLWDEGVNADVKSLQSKIEDLKTVTKMLKIRVKEFQIREEKFQQLQDALNLTETFVQTARQIFVGNNDQEKPLNEGEIKYLEKLIKETQLWREQVQLEFSRMKMTENPKYLSTDFDEKIHFLKRETNYLFQKVQRFVPKPKLTTTVKLTSTVERQSQTENSSTTEENRPDL